MTATKKQQQDEELDRALEDSFPASDPPAMTQPTKSVGAPKDKKTPPLFNRLYLARRQTSPQVARLLNLIVDSFRGVRYGVFNATRY